MNTSLLGQRFARPGVVVLLVLAAAQAACAADQDIHLEKHTTTGRAVRIRGFAPYNHDCQPIGLPSFQVLQAPAHGEVSTREEMQTITSRWVGDVDCTGTRLNGVTVFYRPQPGFEGNDHFVLQVDYPGRLGQARAEVDVTVSPARAP